MKRSHDIGEILGPGDGIDDISITEVSFRNSTYLVGSSAGSRVRKLYAEPGATSRARELAAYRSLAEVRTTRNRPIMPALLDAGDDRIDLDAPAESRSVRGARDWTPAVGEALAALHNADVGSVAIDAMKPPWIMDVPEYSFYLTLSSASRNLMRVLYSGQSGWESLRASRPWRELAITHGDIKWSNVLVIDDDAGPEVRIIDWELCGIGDPAWDVGSFFGEFLVDWAASIPIVSGEPADRYAHLSSRPIERMRPDILEFWKAYQNAMGGSLRSGGELLIASTQYAGLRLIQSAFERAQTMATLNPQVLLLAQLGLNVTADPRAAAERLLGIPPDD